MESSNSFIKKYSVFLYNSRGWIKFAGVVSIIQGIMTFLSLWGIIICWLPIWMGSLLLKASNQIRIAYETEKEDEFISATEMLAKYFKLISIFTIIFTCIAFLGIIAAILIPLFVKFGHQAHP